MSIFAHAQAAPSFKSKSVKVISLVLAAVFIVMAVGQLFTYEDFPAVIGSYWIVGGTVSVHLMAAFLVIGEVFTLPLLLRLRVSPLMRIVSLLAMWFVALVWLVLSLWVVLTPNALTNAGLLGATVPLTPGLWQVIFSGALVILVGLVSWDQKALFRLRGKK